MAMEEMRHACMNYRLIDLATVAGNQQVLGWVAARQDFQRLVLMRCHWEHAIPLRKERHKQSPRDYHEELSKVQMGSDTRKLIHTSEPSQALVVHKWMKESVEAMAPKLLSFRA